jgi:cholesterol oxidase
MDMARLASTVRELQADYDAIIVGSGYGGGVAASRLARMGLKVCVLERGKEYLPGDFPDNMVSVQAETQLNSSIGRIGSPQALFDVRLGDGIHFAIGCGVGGTSLINANVCIAPDDRVLESPAWPERMRHDPWMLLGFGRARDMLQPNPIPRQLRLHKVEALDTAAEAFGVEPERVQLHITFEAKTTAANVMQAACTSCGDCLGGCNVGAKTTVQSTYLADAVNHGAKIFTGMLVRYVEKDVDGGWRVVISMQDKDADRIAPVRAISAKTVVLAAGTLGSTEILLRSRERGLALSDTLGAHVSANADTFAFSINNPKRINAIGKGFPVKTDGLPPGPAVAGLIDLRHREHELDRVVVVEAAIQSSMAPFAPLLVPTVDVLDGDGIGGFDDIVAKTGNALRSLTKGAYAGPAQKMQVLLGVGHDGAGGKMKLEDDRLHVVWPDVAADPVYPRMAKTLKTAAEATGGKYAPNPISHRFLGGKLMSVHPLGGAAMAEDSSHGVVNHKCQVFDAGGAAGLSAVHDGLYVCDGAVMPCSVGVHPLLTITAVAERAMLYFARDHSLQLDITAKADAALRDNRPDMLKAGGSNWLQRGWRRLATFLSG